MANSSSISTAIAGTAEQRPPARNRSARSLLLLNTASNVCLIGLQALISLLIARSIISRLGMDAYGIVAIALTCPNYIRLFSNGITVSVLRFVISSDARERNAETTEYLSTAFVAVCVVAIVFALAIYPAATFASEFLDIPPGLQSESRVLIALTMLAAVFSIIQGILHVSFASNHLFYRQNALQAASRAVCGGSLLVAFYFGRASLTIVGVYYAAASLLTVMLLACFRPRLPTTFFMFSAFSWRRLLSLCRLGSWVFVNDLAVVLYLSISLIIVNRQLDATASGGFGAVMLVNSFVILMLGSIANVILPIVYRIAQEDNATDAKRKLRQLNRVFTFVTGLPVVFLCGNASTLLEAWLGAEHIGLAPLLCIFAVCTWLGGVNSSTTTQFLRGKDRAAVSAITNLVCAIAYIASVSWLLHNTDAGLIAVGISYGFFFSLRGLLLGELYVSLSLDNRFTGMLLDTLAIAIVAIALTGLISQTDSFAPSNPFIRLILNGSVLSLLYLACGKWLLTPDDRQQLMGLIRSRVSGRFASQS